MENTQIQNIQPLDDSNNELDSKLDLVSLDDSEQEILESIVQAPSKEELEKQFALFNINQSKKNAFRIIKLNGLLAKVEDQAISRFEKRPDLVSNKELLEYMNVVSTQIDRAQKQLDSISYTPSIQVNTQQNEVNINIDSDLDRDSKERVINAVTALLQQVKQANHDDNQLIQEDSDLKSYPYPALPISPSDSDRSAADYTSPFPQTKNILSETEEDN